MTTARAEAHAEESGAETGGAETEPMASVDPAAFAPALVQLATGLAQHPVAALRAATRLTGGLAVAGAESVARVLGWEGATTCTPPTDDRRFTDPAWDDNPWFLGHRQAYLALSECARELDEVSGLEGPTAEKATFALGQVVDALAPTNFLWSNPAALRKASETRGASVLAGVANFLDDVAENGARPRQVDASQFEVGGNLACTPGKVVFRNDLMELIQYAPQTESVFEVPLLLSPPWINRFYIMDLAPGRSFVEWAVSHGHTTFAISYRNPDESMRKVTLDDYMLRGLAQALDVVAEITGSKHVNVAGLCVGGTLAVMLSAYLAQAGDERVRSVTLLNTLVDFSEPGALGAFTDAEAVAGVERRMAEHGFLDGREMATTFDSLRANDLIWNYVGSNWLMGQTPPAFDILAWNADPTRVPEATHSGYLRAFYLENRLARGNLALAGRRLRLDDVTADTYVLAAEKDHITPWKSSYATTGLLAGQVRFVLSSAGHIAGIVNPPGPKRQHWTNEELPPEPEAWLADAVQHPGTWWEDWAGWIEARAGSRRSPNDMGSTDHPPVADAPGTYVHG
ncbi:MAG TPA: alpha/beta fold hydrolase [Acidimicrobiales bacterium]|nr:alpha/beta fold hydrolase [Acidimicrobiales bacterium]